MRIFLATVSVLLLSCSSFIAQNDEKNPIGPARDGERIHYGDIVEVDVIGSLDFDWRGGLTPEGFLDGLERTESPVYALCRTEQEVAAAIAERYNRILRDPNVRVRIIDRSNRALAYVTGAIKTPQRFQLTRPVTLTEIIVLSGGITDSSNGEISIFRPPYVNCRAERPSGPAFENAALQAPKRFSVKIRDLLSGNRSADIPILSGDIVSVLQAAPVFVMMEGGAARRMNLTPDLTLAGAVSSAGVSLKEMSGKKIRIYRRSIPAGPLEVDGRRILGKNESPPKLEPYDVIIVQKKGSEESRLVDIGTSDRGEAGALSKLPLRIVD